LGRSLGERPKGKVALREKQEQKENGVQSPKRDENTGGRGRSKQLGVLTEKKKGKSARSRQRVVATGIQGILRREDRTPGGKARKK